MASATDVVVWCVKAGWPATLPAIDCTKAVAVALAQSDGNPGKTGGLFGLGNTGDGLTQTKQAHDLVVASGWDVLPAYRNNSYLLYLPAATIAVQNAGLVKATQNPEWAIGALGDAAGNLVGDTVLDQAKTGIALLVKAGAWLGDPNNWARILLVVLGGGMVIGGVTLAAGSSVGGVAGAAGKLAGKAIKAVK